MTTSARPIEVASSHFYWPDGKPAYEQPRVDGKGTTKTTVAHARKFGLLPSPTTILRLLAKPQLDTWKQEQACLAVLTAPRRDDESLDAFVHRVLHVEREQDAERDAAADMGTAIHDAIECSLNDVEYDPQFKPYVDAVREKLAPYGRCVFSEKILVGDGYAGRTDCGLESDHFITIADFKGCKKLPRYAYDEHLMQGAAYAAALGNTGDKQIQVAIVYIDRNIPGEVAVFSLWPWSDEYAKFRCLVKFWYLSNGVPLPESYR